MRVAGRRHRPLPAIKAGAPQDCEGAAHARSRRRDPRSCHGQERPLLSPPHHATAASFRLVPHRTLPVAGPVRSLTVTLRRDHEGLQLRYQVAADLARLRLPALQPAARVDRLWEHTCFEAFVSGAESTGYREFNFSPSSCWAAWDFTGYRQGMASVPGDLAPVVTSTVTSAVTSGATAAPAATPGVTQALADGQLLVTARVPAALLPGEGAGLRLALAAVIEAVSGERSYWALHHPAPQPDFHAAGSFVLRLPALAA